MDYGYFRNFISAKPFDTGQSYFVVLEENIENDRITIPIEKLCAVSDEDQLEHMISSYLEAFNHSLMGEKSFDIESVSESEFRITALVSMNSLAHKAATVLFRLFALKSPIPAP